MLQVDQAQACLEQAQEYWQSRQWQETIHACAQALALNQKLPLAHKLMGDALQKTNKVKEALGYYREAIQLQPDFAEVYANLGSLYAQQQEYSLATKHYQQALAINPNFTAVKGLLERVNKLHQPGDHDVVQPQSTEATASANLALDNHLQQGDNLHNRGELEAALQQYLTAAKLRPQRVETYREIIKLCEKLGLWADAAKYCRLILRLTSDRHDDRSDSVETTVLESLPTPTIDKSIPQKPKPAFPVSVPTPTLAKSGTNPIAIATAVNDSPNYLEMGQNFVSQGNYEAAISYYRQAIKQDPQLVAAYLAMSELLVQLNQADAAISCYLSGLKQQHHPELYFGLGSVYQAKQLWSKAALCYQKAVQADSNHGKACHELGEVLSQQQNWSGAVQAYRQAIAVQPDFSWSYNNLGYALIQLNQWSDAIPMYQQAIKLKPDFIWSYYNLAEAYGKLGQWSAAIAYYQQAVKLQPDLPEVQQRLGDAFYRRSQQDRQQALEHFVLAIGQNPYNTEAYHQALAIDNRNIALYLKLGDILAESGKTDQAIVTYQMALQAQPRNSEVLARIYQHHDHNLVSSLASSEVMPSLSGVDYGEFVAELESILPHSDRPTVSIIIPVYNQLDYTLKCLKAIAVNLDKSLPVEIILVNDCSTDQTDEVISPLTAVNLINQKTNQGFIYSCNAGAAAAKGQYIYFLNNDTEIKPNCIASLVEVLDADETVGAVGSKLIYPQGSLQEAGGIIWQDASGWNYGRQENPYAPEYNYLRPVDYCSGASLMVRKAVFEQLNGFERNFAPAYYEDTDLCFAIRHQLGMKVMYQPKSVVIHYEGISSGTSVTSGTKKYQAVNAIKFKQKWQAQLQKDYLANEGNKNVLLAARKYFGNRTILVVDSYMPSYDRESGSRRLFELLKIFKGLGYHVIFAADNGVREEPYASVLQDLQIEVLYTQDGYGTAIEEQIESRLDLIDLAWICRPELNQKYAPIVDKKPEIKLIYDTIDLHYLRLKRARALNPEHCTKSAWIEMQAQELKMAHQADLTITVTAIEQEILSHQAVDNVAVIPNVHTPYEGDIPDFESRAGILFIGSYNHLPNVDAVIWLCEEVMPLVWQSHPEIKVTLLGNNPSPEVLVLASDRVDVTGYIDDVSPYFLSHKLSVSPLRYGAGMKGKIGQSLEYGLPVVSTNIGTEGMNLIPERHILEANEAAEFARQIIRLYTNAPLWNLISKNSAQAIAPYSPQAVEQTISLFLPKLSAMKVER
ncbi:MAG: tetratricopeptide repeat protein [Cyanobacteria bacterium J06600_6]